jgi:hypothetical protein
MNLTQPEQFFDLQYLSVDSEHAEVDARLREWARWLRERSRSGRATSLEGNFRHARIENGVIVCDECGRVTRVAFESECPSCLWPFPQIEAARAISSPLDTFRAVRVEKVVSALSGDKEHDKLRLHLKAFYVLRCTPGEIRRRIAVRPSDLTQHLKKSRSMVRNALARLEGSPYHDHSLVNPTAPAVIIAGKVRAEEMSHAA